MSKLRQLSIFDDWRSYVHAAYGIMLAFLPGYVGGIGAAVFAIYQHFESRTDSEFLSDMTEFMIGLIIGGIIYYIISR